MALFLVFIIFERSDTTLPLHPVSPRLEPLESKANPVHRHHAVKERRMRPGLILLAMFAVGAPVALSYWFVTNWDLTPNIMATHYASSEQQLGESLGVGLLFGLPVGLFVFALDWISRRNQSRKVMPAQVTTDQ
jgi:hypothetical protein